MNDRVYIFTDESGNYTFNNNSSKYLVLTALSTLNPTTLYPDAIKVKYNYCIEEFKASENLQIIRNEVFAVLSKHDDYWIDSIIVEKSKTNPSIQDPAILYPKLFKSLFLYMSKKHSLTNYEEVVVFTDKYRHKNKTQAIEKAVKTNLAEILDLHKTPYQLLHHDSKSNLYLQLVDYCGWAIYKKWETQGKELRPYKIICDKISSEFDYFQKGSKRYY